MRPRAVNGTIITDRSPARSRRSSPGSRAPDHELLVGDFGKELGLSGPEYSHHSDRISHGRRG